MTRSTVFAAAAGALALLSALPAEAGPNGGVRIGGPGVNATGYEESPTLFNAEKCVITETDDGLQFDMTNARRVYNNPNTTKIKISCAKSFDDAGYPSDKNVLTTNLVTDLSSNYYSQLRIVPQETPHLPVGRPQVRQQTERERNQAECSSAMRNSYVSGAGAVSSVGAYTKYGNGLCLKNGR